MNALIINSSFCRSFYNNIAKKPRYNALLDKLGRSINSIGIPWATGSYRQKAILGCSVDRHELEIAESCLEAVTKQASLFSWQRASVEKALVHYRRFRKYAIGAPFDSANFFACQRYLGSERIESLFVPKGFEQEQLPLNDARFQILSAYTFNYSKPSKYFYRFFEIVKNQTFGRVTRLLSVAFPSYLVPKIDAQEINTPERKAGFWQYYQELEHDLSYWDHLFESIIMQTPAYTID